MKAWSCQNCEAEIKQETKPDACPLCFRKGCFFEIELPDPTQEDLEFSKKYEESIKIMEKREEGVPPHTLADAACGCGEHHGEEEHAKHKKKHD